MEDEKRPERRLEWCPGCGSGNLRAVIAGATIKVLCRECGSCWHPEADRLRAVDPRHCPGCSSRPVCLRRLWERLEWLGPAGGPNPDDAARHERWS